MRLSNDNPGYKEVFKMVLLQKALYFPRNIDGYGNVFDTVNHLLTQYYILGDASVYGQVCKQLFPDTYVGVYKTLYLTFSHSETSELFHFEFGEDKILDLNHIAKTIYEKTRKLDLVIPVSFGEIVDKYSILELKRKYITHPDKLVDINREINELAAFVGEYKNSVFYKMLLGINDKIWRETDIVKTLTIENKDYDNILKYAELTASIFDDNQRRFRLKNHFNCLSGSLIREHKSYSANSCFVWIAGIDEIYDKIPEINWLCISYDTIVFDVSYRDVIGKIFHNKNIVYIGHDEIAGWTGKKIVLSDYTMPAEMVSAFEFEPIIYKGLGRLGDFLNQLSVVCEKFYDTGRKGVLYIDDNPRYTGGFVYGIERAYTDTYDAISQQKYVSVYAIYSGQKFNIDLSCWRERLNQYGHSNWHHIYSKIYGIQWALHKWLDIEVSETMVDKWKNKIIINMTPYRFIGANAIKRFADMIIDKLEDCVFISNDKEHYDVFCEKMGLNIGLYQPVDFNDMMAIIKCCKTCYLGFSAPAVIANALHKDHYLLGTSGLDVSYNNFVNEVPHLLGIIM